MKAIALLLVVVVVGVIGRYGYAKYLQTYWDDRVSEMCAKEGGLRIVEQIHVSSAEYQSLLGKSNELAVRLEPLSSPTATFFLRVNKLRLHESHPEVIRQDQFLVRRNDGKAVAALITFFRIGGDPGFTDNPSSFSCPNNVGNWFARVIKQRDEK